MTLVSFFRECYCYFRDKVLWVGVEWDVEIENFEYYLITIKQFN